MAGIGGAVLLCIAGVLYVQWRPEYGSEDKTRQALNVSGASENQPPPPLSLQEVEGANLLKVLQQREVQLGKHAIALRMDKRDRARMTVIDPAGKRHEFTLVRSGSPMASAVDETLRDPDKSGFGFIIERKNDKHVLRASAAGFVADVDVADLDAGLTGLLEKKGIFQRCKLAPGGPPPGIYLDFPYRSKKPWSLREETGQESIHFENAEPETAENIQVFAKTP